MFQKLRFSLNDMIHFELMFIQGVKFRGKFFCMLVGLIVVVICVLSPYTHPPRHGCVIVLALLLKGYPSCIELFCILVKDQLSISVCVNLRSLQFLLPIQRPALYEYHKILVVQLRSQSSNVIGYSSSLTLLFQKLFQLSFPCLI